MKNFRFLIVILGAVFLVAGICSFATAAPQVTATQVQRPMPTIPRPNLTINPCPQGWKKVSSGEKGSFGCKPNKPKPVPCPPGTFWEDRSQTNCNVGCVFYN